MWNGTAPTLNENPTKSSASPPISSGSSPRPFEVMIDAISDRLVVPVEPYISAMPYSRNAVENAPSRKYFSAASAEEARLRSRPVRT